MNSIRLRSVMAFFPLALPLCAAAAEYVTYIGTSGPNSKGIYAFRFNSKSGKLNPLGLVAETPRPSFLRCIRTTVISMPWPRRTEAP